jgi:hypothetical protein
VEYELSDKDEIQHLLRFYFGVDRGESESGVLRACVSRAYRDTNRSIHGLQSYTTSNLVEIARIHQELRERRIPELKNLSGRDFDSWHKKTAHRLVAKYAKYNRSCSRPGSHGRANRPFTMGHAQKWINMTLKYAVIFGGELDYVRKLFPVLHVPIDNVIAEKMLFHKAVNDVAREEFRSLLQACGMKKRRAAVGYTMAGWGDIQSYPSYLALQHWIRRNYAKQAPLAVEMDLWRPVRIWTYALGGVIDSEAHNGHHPPFSPRSPGTIRADRQRGVDG